MVSISIVSPTQDEKVAPGALVVFGFVGCGGASAPAVTVQLDQQTPVRATVNPCELIPHTTQWIASYHATVTVPKATAEHLITATSGQNKATVTIEVGNGVTNAFLTGACTAKSALTLTSADTIGLQFSPPSAVKITTFPEIIFPTVNFAAGVTLDVTMSLNASLPLTGAFDGATGSISIPGVTLNVNATITAPLPPPLNPITESASGTLAITLTTEPTSSPEAPPVFTDNGERLQPSGQVLLVGDGRYSNPIFGMTDGAIALTGVISPHP
jgi:hypothetical protein